MMDKDIKNVLFTREQIVEAVTRIADGISRDYSGLNPLVVGILKGSFIFMADLVRAIKTPCELDFMAVSSYGAGTRTSGEVKIIKDLNASIAGRHVIVMEDILDSGLTLSYILGVLKARQPASIALCALLNKPDRRRIRVECKYIGFDIPDEFVVGYGLDYREKYRNLPYIGVLDPKVYL